ncbi:hypothetical protein H9P43_002292 [Blastocladiella emersonii ATCC 22665]|nr:hypothetical protein H9P43_002292 [Blastocladiella emersonii ATCC 22665]
MNQHHTRGYDVVLFGWVDGSREHISKYKSLYAPEGDGPGCSSFHIELATTTDVFYSATATATAARRAALRQFLADRGHLDTCADLPARPLVFHMFSNGGVTSLAALVVYLKMTTGEELRGVHAMLFDSAPTPSGHLAMWAGTEVATMPMKLSPAAQYAARWALYVPLWLHANLVARPLGHRHLFNRSRDMILNTPVFQRAPKLFLYSGGDTLIAAEHVECMIERLREQVQGAKGKEMVFTAFAPGETAVRAEALATQPPSGTFGRLETVKFPADSPHVLHFRRYPEQYRAATQRFLAKL